MYPTFMYYIFKLTLKLYGKINQFHYNLNFGTIKITILADKFHLFQKLLYKNVNCTIVN